MKYSDLDDEKRGQIMRQMMEDKVSTSAVANFSYQMTKSGNEGMQSNPKSNQIGLYENMKGTWPPPKLELACRKGCALCCHLNVSTSSFETKMITDAIDKLDDDVKTKVVERAEEKWERSKKFHEAGDEDGACSIRHRCPLLGDDNGCLIYEDRPLSCRAFNSVSLKKCEEGAVEGSHVEMQQWAFPMMFKQDAEVGHALAVAQEKKMNPATAEFVKTVGIPLEKVILDKFSKSAQTVDKLSEMTRTAKRGDFKRYKN